MKINLAGLVSTVTAAIKLPTGEVGDKAISVGQIRDFIITKSSGTINASSLRGCGTVPVELLAAPGANKYYSDIRISVSYKGGAVAFDFSDWLTFKTVGGDGQFFIQLDDINTTNSANFDLVKQGQKMATNAAYVLTTNDAANATVGDGDIDYVIYYTIQDANT